MTTKISNKEKIMLVLKEMKCGITNKDLADYTRIPVKNIGKNLKDLELLNYIARKTVQEGKTRFTENYIPLKATTYACTHTYSEFMKQLEQDDMRQAINENIENSQVKDLPINQEIVKEIQEQKEHVYIVKDCDDIKTELLTIIKTIAIRTQDAHKLGFKTHQELTKKIISLILKL